MRSPQPQPARPLTDFIEEGVIEELRPRLREDAEEVIKALIYPKHSVLVLGEHADEVHVIEYIRADDPSASVLDDTVRIEVHGRPEAAGEYTMTVRKLLDLVLVASGTVVAIMNIAPIPE